MIQSLILVVMILLGLFVFKIDPLKKDVKHLTLAAIFVVLNALFKSLAVRIPLFGFPTLEIGLNAIPLMMAGVILGPSWGYLTGLVCDLIGLIVAPTNFPFLGFTLSSITRACLPAILYFYYRRMSKVFLERCLKVGLCVAVGLAWLYIFNLSNVTISKINYEVTPSLKIGLALVCAGVIGLLICSLFYMKKRFDQNHYETYLFWIISVCVTEITLSFIFSPLWLNIMYQIPILASLFVRVFKAFFMIPLELVICYMVYVPIKRFIQ